MRNLLLLLTLQHYPQSPIPDKQNLLLSDDKSKLNIVNTEQYNDFLNKVNNDLTNWSDKPISPLFTKIFVLIWNFFDPSHFIKLS